MKKNLSFRPGLESGIKFYVLVFLCLCIVITIQAQVYVVKDINQHTDVNASEFSSLTDVAGTLYFTSKAKELWKTDGTAEGSIKLKEFTSMGGMKNVGGMLYFFASDETLSMSLWKSDGSANGTIKVKESISGTDLTVVNNMLFFIGNGGGKGLEVWRSDGTTAGTYILKDIMKGGGNSNPTSLVSFNNKLFFVANNGTNGYEVWESDGTTLGTHLFKDIIPGKTSSAPNYLTAAGNTLFFMARDAALGQEVWKTDGTPEGTVVVRDIKPGSGSSFPSNFISVNDNIFFRANDGKNNFQLWRSDGTSEGTIKLTSDGYSWINGNIAIGNYLYYMLGRTLFRTDGTPSGTQMICEIEDFYNTKEMVEFNGSLYVMSTDYDVHDLWRIDGLNASIIKQASAFVAGGDLRSGLTQSGNSLYFVGNGGNDFTLSLWKSDGTTAGTVSFLDLFNTTQSSYPHDLTDVNGQLYFNATESSNTGLWKSDGTESGTTKVADIYASNFIDFNGTVIFKSYIELYKTDGTPGGTVPVPNSFAYAENLTVVGNSIFFKGYRYQRGYELWKTDGTQTSEVKSIFNGDASSNPEYLTNVNGVLFFSANDGVTGIELWKSDGTESGTVRVKDINPGSAGSSPQKLIAYNGELYFVAYLPGYGYELLKSNGTDAGTMLLKDINTSDEAYLDIDNLIVANGTLYFMALDGVSGWALWKSDGTTAGTVKLKDFYPGTELVRFLKSFNDELYMIVTDGQYNNPTLWKTDGTELGTLMIKTLGIKTTGNTITSVIHKGVMYINVYNQETETVWFNYQVWVTDGTSCGTFKIPFEGSIDHLASSGSTLFVSAYIDSIGFELLRIDESEIAWPSCSSVARSVVSSESVNESGSSVSISYFPNPFQKSFSLNVKGADNATYSLRAVHINGVELEGISNLKCNVDYTLGANWSSGLYLLKIQLENKTVTKKVIKIN